MSVVVEKEAQVNFHETIPASSGRRITKAFNADGKLTQVLFHFPPGTSGLVDVRLLKNEQPFYPSEGFLSLDDSTPIFYTLVDYYQNEPLTVEVQNRDSINAHAPTVSVTIRYAKQPWDEM